MNNKIKKFLPGLFLVALFAFSPFSASATEVYVIDLGGGNCRVILCEDGGSCSQQDGTWSQSGGEKCGGASAAWGAESALVRWFAGPA